MAPTARTETERLLGALVTSSHDQLGEVTANFGRGGHNQRYYEQRAAVEMGLTKASVGMSTLGWCTGAWMMWKLPRPRPRWANDPGTGPPSRVSVVIPARDEQGSIEHLLASLSRQSQPPAEVIVVDDHSTDATGTLAGMAGATVTRPPELPAGWTGKTWACHHGAGLASGDVLVFLDADVILAPEALASLVAELGDRGGLVSVAPYHYTEALYERLSAVCNLVSMMATGAFRPFSRHRPPSPMAFGPCMVICAADYRRIGGHAHYRVRGMIAEDIGLASEASRAGLPISLFAGRDLVEFRMYPKGLSQLVEGWTKVLGTGARRSSILCGAGASLWVAGSISATWELLAHPSRRSALAYAAWSAQIGWMLRRVGRFGGGTAMGYPVPLVAFLVLFARSTILETLGRPLRWRGRSVPGAARGDSPRAQ